MDASMKEFMMKGTQMLRRKYTRAEWITKFKARAHKVRDVDKHRDEKLF